MPRRAARLLIAAATMLLTSGFWLTPTIAQSSPTGTALSAFEAMHSAENGGANITSLVDQYNNLLQQSSPDSSFVTLGQLAADAQENAIALRSFNQTLTLVLVPAIALVLALAGEGLLQLRRKIQRERTLQTEIRQE